MKALLVVPMPDANAGDGVIEDGVCALLDECFPGIAVHRYYIESPTATADDIAGASGDRLALDGYSLLVVCGTPWLWDRCEESRKYADLSALVDAMPRATKIALGIGACLPLLSDPSLLINVPATMRRLRELWQHFALITVRDSFAKSILDAAGVPSLAVPCPSVLAGERIAALKPQAPVKRNAAIVVYAPQLGISRDALTPEFVGDYLAAQLAFASTPNVDVACILPTEAEWVANALGRPLAQVGVLADRQSIYRYVGNRPLLITGRIHVAIPAFMAGTRCYVLPVDTRYRTAQELGVPICWRIGGYLPVARLPHESWRDLLRLIGWRSLLIPPSVQWLLQRSRLDMQHYRRLLRERLTTLPIQ